MRRGLAGLGVMAQLGVGSVALAQPGASVSAKQPAGQPVLTPPRPISDTEVLRPEGTKLAAEVLLELTIDARGAVSAVRVVRGVAPFSDAAEQAAKAWKFRPALRGEEPVSSRIRLLIKFPEPEGEPAAEADEQLAGEPAPVGAAEAGGEAPAASEVDVEGAAPVEEEFLVLGERAPTGGSSMTRAEVRQLPGAFGDPFRAVEALPGVTPILSGVPFFYVRGAPPGNVGYFLDGIKVPLLYHIGLGPSVVHPGIVRKVDLYPGGYPAGFGRFAGGIVSGETAAPSNELHGEASIRLVDMGALVEAPFAEGKGSALVGGRYSYTGLVLSAFAPEALLRYWDYQARASYELSESDRLSLFSFGAYDYLGENDLETGEDKTFFNTEFHRVDLRWDRRHTARVDSRTALYVGLDKTEGEENTFVRDRMLHLRHQLEYRQSPRAHYLFGADIGLDHYDLQMGGDDEDDDRDVYELFPARTDWAAGAYAQLTWLPERWVAITPGLRVDWYYSDSTAALALEPRLSARYEVSPSWRLTHAIGLAHQPPAFVIPMPGFQMGGLDGGLQRAVQYSAGAEVDLPWDITASVNLFQNTFFNMNDLLGDYSPPESDSEPPAIPGPPPGGGAEVPIDPMPVDDGGDRNEDRDRLEKRNIGRAYGLEVYLKRRLTRRLGGFLAYTLSRSERGSQAGLRPAGFDRTHVFNAALAYDLGRRWRFGNRFVYYSGFPADNIFGRGNQVRPGQRVPDFWRVDFRLEKRWALGQRGFWALVFEVVNTTLNKETIEVRCNSDWMNGQVSNCHEEKIGPVTIPSIGVEAFF